MVQYIYSWIWPEDDTFGNPWPQDDTADTESDKEAYEHLVEVLQARRRGSE